MEYKIKNVKAIFFDKVRNGDDIYNETDLSFDELIDKYYNITEEKLPKNHICILRDIYGNNKGFDEEIEYYRNFSEYSKAIDYNTTCENCSLKCCNNIDLNFNFFAAVFVMDIWNRRFTYNNDVNLELTNLFFKQFYIEENEIKFHEDKMLSLFLDYDIEILEKGLLKNSSITNIKALLEIKNQILSLENRFNNLVSEKNQKLETYINFVNIKLEFYQNIYNLEKEEQLLLEKKSKKLLDKKLKPLKEIWLPTAKISIKDLLKIGVENKIWDKDNNIITERGNLYGTGKSMLASLSIALKGFALPNSIDHQVIGNAFCKVFNVNVDRGTKQPFKSFCSGNPKNIKHFKRLLKI